ncbi:uncharacterized protein LOC112463139 isoform X2 [Temnothorax curvispinosus]|nr:uncharacterized protein LOC112463139 isoform X2 [Temnothorax curvispinosus]
MRSQFLINEKEQVVENLCKIQRKFKIDRERFKKRLYNNLLDLANIFQFEVPKHVPRSIPNLLSENIALKNQLSMMTDSAASNTRDYMLCRNAVKKYKRKTNDVYLCTKRSIVISKLEKSTIIMLHEIHKKANVNLSKLVKFNYFTEEQYIINKDNGRILARKYETRVKHAELLLYCEKEKFTIVENQKHWISGQFQEYLQILYNITYVLKNLKIKASNNE